VQPSSTVDLTERESAPPVWPAPSARAKLPAPPVPIPELVRSRKATLVSPIPALLAAQMTEIVEELSGATPFPLAMRQEPTSRFDISDQQILLSSTTSDEDDYVVELVHPVKSDR
jgi:hypothetical protein